MKLLKFPVQGIQDIPSGLRKLADDIESGKFDDAHNVAWIIDCGNSRIEYGLLGKAASPGAEFNILLDVTKHKFINAASLGD